MTTSPFHDPVPEPGAVAPPAPVDRRRPRRATGAVVGSAVLVTAAVVSGGALLLGRALVGVTAAGSFAPSSASVRVTGGDVPGDGGYGPWDAPQAGGYRGSWSYDGWAPDGSSVAPTTTDASPAQSGGLVEITSSLVNGQAAGTGLVWRSDGLVVTNHHVVAGATKVEVTVVSTGATYTARYVGGDASADVAVLRLVGASGLDTVERTGSAVAIGQGVTAVGDAGGDGGALTAAPGTIEAVGQDVTVQDGAGGARALTDLVRINADIVPGDSGGAVLDAAGRVVAMNVAASSGSVVGTGYAIPIGDVASVVALIVSGRETGAVDLGYPGHLGVALDPSSAEPRVVQAVPGGAAARAGITAGDTITTVGRTPITSADQLRSTIGEHAPGDRVVVSWTTAAGSSRSATVTLGRGPIA